jgi:hypothetical protein
MRLALKFEKLRVEVELAETATTRIVGDPRRLAAVKAGESVTVEKA